MISNPLTDIETAVGAVEFLLDFGRAKRDVHDSLARIKLTATVHSWTEVSAEVDEALATLALCDTKEEILGSGLLADLKHIKTLVITEMVA